MQRMADEHPTGYLASRAGQRWIDGRATTSVSFAPPAAQSALASAARDVLHRLPFEVEDVDPPVDFEPISRTKISPAPVRPETLHRERLLDWLDRHTRRRLTFVIANAGYGKTTLLADFSERL